MRHRLRAIACAVLALAWALPAQAETPPRPHIVFVLADDLGWKDLGYQGSEIRTPTLDRLAAEGTRFDRHYVMPVCTPTRAALLTGRHPVRYGLQDGVFWPWTQHGLSPEERTLAEALREAGYRTALVGKWHLGAHTREVLPRAQGFEHQYGPYNGVIDYYTHRYRRGLDWRRNGEPVEEKGYATGLFANEAVRLIAAHDPATPLFLYLPVTAPHSPLQVPKRYFEMYAEIEDRNRRIYAGMVTALDDLVARVVAALDARGMLENTLIVFLSDNGGDPFLGASNEPLRGGKGGLWEGGVRVPGLAYWKGTLPPAGVVGEPVHAIDWYPTLLKLAGGSLEQERPLDGVDLWPAIARGEPLGREELLLSWSPSQSAIVVGDWKLLRASALGRLVVHLYNVRRDPGEERNLADIRRKERQDLEGRLSVWAGRAQRPLGPFGRNPPLGQPMPEVWGPD